jgi:hypothetical protein
MSLPEIRGQKAIGPGLDTKGRNKLFVYKQAVKSKSTGLPDRRVKNTDIPYSLAGGNRAGQIFGTAMLVFNAAYFVNQQIEIFGVSEDRNELYDQGLALSLVLNAIQSGLANGSIDSKFNNLCDISLIAQVMLFGESPDASVSPELYKTAASTYNANRQLFGSQMETSHRTNCFWWGWETEEMPLEQPCSPDGQN